MIRTSATGVPAGSARTATSGAQRFLAALARDWDARLDALTRHLTD